MQETVAGLAYAERELVRISYSLSHHPSRYDKRNAIYTKSIQQDPNTAVRAVYVMYPRRVILQPANGLAHWVCTYSRISFLAFGVSEAREVLRRSYSARARNFHHRMPNPRYIPVSNLLGSASRQS